MKLLFLGDFLIKYNLYFIGVLFFLNKIILFSNPNLILGENKLIELLQAFFLICGIVLNFNNRNFLFKKFSKKEVFSKIIFILFLFYEEISIFSKGLFKFTESLNLQDELNIHNSIFFKSKYFDIPYINENIGLITIFEIIFFLVISFGYLNQNFRKIKIFLFEKKHSFFTFIYLLNISISFLLRKIGLIEERLIHTEIVELLFYELLFVDSVIKVHISKGTNIK